jgi:alanine racemase
MNASDTGSTIELSASALARNVAVFRQLQKPTQLGAVLKGNAYGHGFLECIPLFHPLVDVFYVITCAEALAIRAFETAQSVIRKPVLVIGALSPADCVALARAQVAGVASDVTFAASVSALEVEDLQLEVQVHFDTGLSREGFSLRQIETGALDFLKSASVKLTGLLSHFANTEDVTEQSYAQKQLHNFEACCAAFEKRLALPVLQRHLAASAASLVLPKARCDVMRVGISLYGLWPSSETKLSARLVLGALPALEPVLSWRVKSQAVKWLGAGSDVGYGCTYRCHADTRVAILPVGYWDGYPRLASGKAHVLIHGRRCPVLGRVMMNHLIVDVTHAVQSEAPVVATLLGRDGDEHVSAETLAGWAQTIHYEVLARLGSHVKRVVTD